MTFGTLTSNEHRLFPTVLLTFIAWNLAVPGDGSLHAGDDWGRDDNAIFLVYGQTLAVHRKAPDSTEHLLSFIPLATLCGDFDPTTATHLEARMWYSPHAGGGGGGGAVNLPVRQLPAAGDFILAVIHRYDGSYSVVNDRCTFMPENSPIVKVDGLFGDVVHSVSAKLRAARTGAATRPARAFSDVERLRAEFRTGRPVSLGERLEIAATSTEPEALRLLVKESEPREVHLLVAMNPHTPEDILELYARITTAQYAVVRAAAEWNLANRPPSTQPATQRAQDEPSSD